MSGQNKKRSCVLRIRKMLPKMIDEKSHRRWWAANSDLERRDWVHAFPTMSPHSQKGEGHNGVGLILTPQVLQKINIQKVGTQKRRKPAFITVKYVRNSEKGPTMTWRIEWWRRLLAISDMLPHTRSQCSDNDVPTVAAPALLHEKNPKSCNPLGSWPTTLMVCSVFLGPSWLLSPSVVFVLL